MTMSGYYSLIMQVLALGARPRSSSEVIIKARQVPDSIDVQAHRGGRGHVVENTLPAFAWALINGATSLEMDNGITKDGHVIVWHDENIIPTKCKDTAPAFPGDPMYPYVGQYVANLSLAQVKTLDCGSIRQSDYPRQILYPGTRVSTLPELFEFLDCADPARTIKLNIESKSDAQYTNYTVAPEIFVERQYDVFSKTAYWNIPGAITYQSFDWRTLVGMKQRGAPNLKLSALVDYSTAAPNVTSPWLAGVNPDAFPGPTFGAKVAQAAHSIVGSTFGVLSPGATAPALSNTTSTVAFKAGADLKNVVQQEWTTQAMVEEAHRLGLEVKPWTVDDLSLVQRLVTEYGVDGLITDYPMDVLRWATLEASVPVSGFESRHDQSLVLECLARYHQTDSIAYLGDPSLSTDSPSLL